ncbi:MAG: DegV family protein [Candidatus Dormibacteria bacterium]
MAVRIVTDSTCDLPEERRRELGVVTVPLRLQFEEREYRDRVDLEDAEFLRLLGRADRPPRTSQPPPGDFEAAYRELLQAPGDEVISIHIAAKLSGTVSSATVAAQAVGPERVQVVDSRSVSLGTGFQVLRAAELAAQGMGASGIAAALAPMGSRTGILCLLDTVRYLQLGGRIGKVQALLGSALSIKPLISLGQDGALVPLGRVRSRTAGLRLLNQRLAEHPRLEALGILHVGERSTAEDLASKARGTFPQMEILVQHASPVLSTHCGPGTVAYCYLETGA